MSMMYGSIAVLVMLVAAPFWVMVSTRNRLVALDQRCATAFADIDAHLKHRQNILPGMVETVRGYTRHEHEVLLGVSQARAAAQAAVTPEARLEAERDLTQTINALIGAAERYPELKASGHFMALRDELVAAENRITAARRFYNLAVGEYGASLRQFPGSLVARRWRMELRAPFDLGIERALIDEPAAFRF